MAARKSTRKDETQTEAGPKEVIITAVRGNQDVNANSLKTDAVSILMTAASKVVPGAEYYETNAVCLLIMPDIPGDLKWMDRNVFKYADLIGTSTPSERARRANRLIELYTEAGGREAAAMGTEVFRRQFEEFGMNERSAAVIRRA